MCDNDRYVAAFIEEKSLFKTIVETMSQNKSIYVQEEAAWVISNLICVCGKDARKL